MRGWVSTTQLSASMVQLCKNHNRFSGWSSSAYHTTIRVYDSGSRSPSDGGSAGSIPATLTNSNGPLVTMGTRRFRTAQMRVRSPQGPPINRRMIYVLLRYVEGRVAAKAEVFGAYETKEQAEAVRDAQSDPVKTSVGNMATTWQIEPIELTLRAGSAG